MTDARYDEGLSFLAEAASRGDAEAAYALALELDLGTTPSTEAEKSRVAQLYRQAADAGHHAALTNYAWCLSMGFGVERDPAAAHGLWSEAAEWGDVTAAANVGQDFELGRGAARDLEAARGWYARAAADGHHGAAVRLARLLMAESSSGVDHRHAVRLLEGVWSCPDASPEDRAHAAGDLGRAYEDGRGVEADVERAVSLYARSAEMGDDSAQVDLGWLLYNGEGVPEDPARAVTLYERAAEQGNLSAMYNLGIAHQDGRGAPRNASAAREWYSRAAEAGHEGARECPESMAGGGDVGEDAQ